MKTNKFILIAGPCVIESKGLVEEIAGRLKEITAQHDFIDFYFKASFDKANRSAHDSFRGPGLEKGCEILKNAGEKFGLKTITDVHESYQCDVAAQAVSALQIPAFLCRQTDLVQSAAQACAKYGRVINVKKAQFLAPWDMKNVVEKVRTVAPAVPLWLTERGSTFGYNNLVVDMTSFAHMRSFGVPVIFDATHSVQLPGGAAGGKVTGGRREFIAPLSRAALGAGIDGIFMETHPRVAEAKSDAANAFPLADVPRFIQMVADYRQLAQRYADQ
jgi:2-dehydro-3-deoxyphosphooctonate aldolase (KDO 8-P synthase)